MSQSVHVVVLKGCPASGKTTYAKELVTNNGYKRINNDDIRKLLDFSFYSKENEEVVRQTTAMLLSKFVSEGKNVVIDNVHAGKQHFDSYARTIEKLNTNCILEEKPFYVDLETAIRRDKDRLGDLNRFSDHVGESIVKKFWSKLGGESFKDYKPRRLEFKRMEPVVIDNSKPACVIVDIDGTVAHSEGIRSPYDYSKVHLDQRDYEVINLIHAYGQSTLCYVIFVSGRTDDCELLTREWLNKNFGDYDALFMRKNGDNRPDFIVKREILETKIIPNWNPILVFDDRTQVVNMWRNSGLKCLQVSEGNF